MIKADEEFNKLIQEIIQLIDTVENAETFLANPSKFVIGTSLKVYVDCDFI